MELQTETLRLVYWACVWCPDFDHFGRIESVKVACHQNGCVREEKKERKRQSVAWKWPPDGGIQSSCALSEKVTECCLESGHSVEHFTPPSARQKK